MGSGGAKRICSFIIFQKVESLRLITIAEERQNSRADGGAGKSAFTQASQQPSCSSRAAASPRKWCSRLGLAGIVLHLRAPLLNPGGPAREGERSYHKRQSPPGSGGHRRVSFGESGTSELLHSRRTFCACCGKLSPDPPLRLSSSLNHPAPFRHLSPLPPALGSAQDPATAGPGELIHSATAGFPGRLRVQACFPERPAGRARGYPAQAGSTSRRPEIPREQSSRAKAACTRPAHPGIWGGRSNADPNGIRQRFDLEGLAPRPIHPRGYRLELHRRQSGAQNRPLSPLGSSLSSGSQSDPDVMRANDRGQSIKSG
ncbi:uncharacterized protein LOC131492438 [Neofelis nebulosa]|uniref:uncharacterized protein LOC131492438 n=1 Tax=Neofelis nebulosa TaxID=61452 RepID=UPI00272C08DA|nr:uncharacterized protein LOC131492438 [Neofelis nebulosa]